MAEILFLAHRIPYPPDRGDKIRSFHILKHLAALAPVHLAAFADDEADLAHLRMLEPLTVSRHVEVRHVSHLRAGIAALASQQPVSLPLFKSATMHAHVEQVLARPEVTTIFAFSGQMAQYVPERLGRRRFVMDFVDMDSAKFVAYAKKASGPMRWIMEREGSRLFAFEKLTAQRAHRSLFVSEAEAALFRRQSGIQQRWVDVLENGIDLDHYDPAVDHGPVELAGQGPLIVFTGQMDYRPNAEAVSLFARETMPLIRARVRDARFAIVGRNPDADVKALDTLPGVYVTGEVPEIRCWLAAADVVVAPLRLARGIQNKVLEAMAMACPVVASPAAAEGIDATPGTELVIADGSAAEAEAVVTLLGDRTLAHDIGTAARARMAARYGWDARLAPLGALVGIGKPALEPAA